MSATIVYSTSTKKQQPGWATVDRMTLWAIAQHTQDRPDVDQVAAFLPEGFSHRLIETTLTGLIADGLVQDRQSSVRVFGGLTVIGSGTVYELTFTGRAQLSTRYAQAA